LKTFLALLILTFSGTAFAKGEITFRTQSLIQHGSPIVLGDIVDVMDIDPRIKERLLKLPLGTAPNPGEKVEFSNAAISGTLRPIFNYLQGLPKLKIPNHVTIERSSHVWSQAVIEKELINTWQGLCKNCQLEIDRLTMPAGTFENWTMTPKKELPRGAFSVPVEVTKAGNTATLWLQGNLVIKKSVPVAKRAIFFGERVKVSDFEWSYRDVTLSQDGAPSQEEIGTNRVKSSLRADDILFSGMLEHEKALHRGELARVISLSSGWEITLNAVAQSDAEVGDTVTLKNPKTNKDLVGTVVAKGEVEIQ
jgi:flagella basal body P-ring formation protein FlgA